MRDMTLSAAAKLQSNYLRTALFVELHFQSSVEYIWNGYGPIQWSGQTWQGIGTLGSISTVTEDSTLTAQGLTLTLSGIDPALLGEALTEVRPGLPCRIYLVLPNAAGMPEDAITAYAGRMDQSSIEDGPETGTVTITVENRLSDLQRAQFRRLTDQDQRLRFPTDDGFKFVNSLQDWNGSWGAN